MKQNNQPPKDKFKVMEEELTVAGWKKIRHTIWQAPDGTHHLGPSGAHRKMKKATQLPDPKLSIVEEFGKVFPMVGDIDGNKHSKGDDYAVGYKNGHIAGVGLALIEGFKVAKSFLLAALEAHGKAEYERGRKEEAEHYKLFPQNPYADTIKAHAAGFTEGVILTSE